MLTMSSLTHIFAHYYRVIGYTSFSVFILGIFLLYRGFTTSKNYIPLMYSLGLSLTGIGVVFCLLSFGGPTFLKNESMNKIVQDELKEPVNIVSISDALAKGYIPLSNEGNFAYVDVKRKNDIIEISYEDKEALKYKKFYGDIEIDNSLPSIQVKSQVFQDSKGRKIELVTRVMGPLKLVSKL